MPQMFTNKCTDIFSGPELSDMYDAMKYKSPKVNLDYETYLTQIDKTLAVRLNYVVDPYQKNLFMDPSYMLKFMCFDTLEYDLRVRKIKDETRIVRRAETIIKKYSQVIQ